jgi:hypothetical protein
MSEDKHPKMVWFSTEIWYGFQLVYTTITIINNSLIIIYFINKELLVRHNIPICSYRDIKLWLNIMVVNTLWNKRHVFGTNDRKPA